MFVIISILFIFFGNFPFSIIGFIAKKKQRIRYLLISLGFFILLLCEVYWKWLIFSDLRPGEQILFTNEFKFGVIIINSIFALITILLLIKEIIALKKLRPKCPKCSSDKGIQRCSDRYFKNKDGQQIEITFSCLDCGYVILKDTWPVDYYNESPNMKYIYDHRTEVYLLGGVTKK